MSTSRLSSENLHATTVAKDGRAVMLSGVSGSGKSDLALRLIDRGFTLVSDDRTLVAKADGRVIATAPATIRGKIEVRGLGIVEMDCADDAPVALFVELTSDVERLPDEGRDRVVFGVRVPMVTIDAKSASAPVKVELALDRFGLRFD